MIILLIVKNKIKYFNMRMTKKSYVFSLIIVLVEIHVELKFNIIIINIFKENNLRRFKR